MARTLSEGVGVPWMPVAEFALQIGPEFLENIAGHIDAGLDAQPGNRVARGPIVRVVRVGDGDRGRVAEELRAVEFAFPPNRCECGKSGQPRNRAATIRFPCRAGNSAGPDAGA
jgi:hypothetical protein